MANATKYYGTGRRKKSIARVYLVPGKGDITINKRTIDTSQCLNDWLNTLWKITNKNINVINKIAPIKNIEAFGNCFKFFIMFDF